MTGRVEHSSSTWRQPWPPPPATGERRELLARVASRVQAFGTTRVRVAVDGRTAAGKTTFGHELANVLSDMGRVVLRCSLDDFKRPWSERHLYDRVSGEGYYRNAYDLDAVRTLLLEPAAPNGSGLVALCSIDPLTQRDHAHVRVTMPDDGVLIVDSVFAFRPELIEHWDLRIWLDIDTELSIRRGTERDASREGAEAARALHRNRYAVAEDLYVAEAHAIDIADLVIDNTDFERPILLRG